jgi:hypothetical protein
MSTTSTNRTPTLRLLSLGTGVQNTAEANLLSLTERVPRLHAFGIKTLGLRRFADAITSSDPAAWSLHGRYVHGCSSSHRRESNCLRFALEWHAKRTNSERNEVTFCPTPHSRPRHKSTPTLDSRRTGEAKKLRFSQMGSSPRPDRRATVRLTGHGKCSSAFTTSPDVVHRAGLDHERKGSHDKEPVA